VGKGCDSVLSNFIGDMKTEQGHGVIPQTP